MASIIMAPTISSFSTKTSIKEYKMSHITPRKSHSIKAMRAEKPLEELYKGHSVNVTREEKPLEELYNVRVERKVPPERLVELGVSGWSMWKTGKCKLPWNWHIDQFVYIEEGEVRVVPEGSHRFMQFLAGDLVRYPKWFEADLFFNGFYQERYSFRAYGDDY
ncbi:hypothetical protein RHGRI_017940 [Rhododendron griersonianum]|uniref:(S)-ureidoglycine aminohydrolase cupin domain-containing protein n=2 Tax=Rhododendron TaxID=4346 RepID=A0AAV6JZM4_9ERIC|nr:hypothetical protein RHGRI_017940 [Rhododendron griersonianum]